jgi:hypothetical protein
MPGPFDFREDKPASPLPRQRPRHTGSLPWWPFVVLLVAAGVAVLTYATWRSRPQASEAVKVAAADLCDAYRSDPVEADRKYRRGAVEVSGYFVAIDTYPGGYKLGLSKDKQGAEYRGLDEADVRCRFYSRDAGNLAGLKRGQPIVVRGRVEDTRRGQVDLTDCVRVP